MPGVSIIADSLALRGMRHFDGLGALPTVITRCC
jgi:hypothetical protein